MLKKVIYTLALLGSIGLSEPIISSVNLEFTIPKTAKDESIKSWLQTDKKIKSVVDTINQEFIIPTDIKLIIGNNSGGVKDGYLDDNGISYDPQTHSMTIPYGFVNDIQQFYTANYYGDSTQAQAHFVSGALIHTLYHELGHALMDILDLPIVGKEEDVADDFATLMLINLHQKSHERLVSAADLYWFMEDSYEELSGKKLTQNQGIDSQRAYQIICLLYGSSPKSYAIWVLMIIT